MKIEFVANSETGKWAISLNGGLVANGKIDDGAKPFQTRTFPKHRKTGWVSRYEGLRDGVILIANPAYPNDRRKPRFISPDEAATEWEEITETPEQTAVRALRYIANQINLASLGPDPNSDIHQNANRARS